MKIGTKMLRGSFVVLACSVLQLSNPTASRADGMPDEVPAPKHRVVQPAPTPYQAPREVPVERREVPPAVRDYEEPCEWKFRTSLGVPVWFFDEEDTLPGAGAYFDTWRTDTPLSFRVGVEGRHMYLGQEAADFAREWPDKTTKITYLRIPFALEYMHPLAENTTGFIGVGPDIIHTANDLSETSVGLHVSARLHYAFDEHWGTSLEGGYVWAEVDGEGEDVELDNAYITPALSYTF